jgi:hypothetical protein
MSVLIRRCLGRSRMVEELVENWQIDHQQAMFARDIEELIVECIELAELVRRGRTWLADELFDEKIDNIDKAGEMLRTAISKALLAYDRVQKTVEAAEQMQFTIDNARQFRAVVRELRDIEDEVKKTWPTVNRQMVNDSLAAYARGEFRTTEDLLGDTQDCSPAAH